MEITVGLFFILVALAFICEFIDSSLGMGYGTILSPVLIIMGFEPLICVPAILLTQACGGLAASIFHQRFRNVSFKLDSKDSKIVLVISGFGVIATIIAVIVALKIPKALLQTYIGTIVFIMGVIILLNKKFRFSWNKMVAVGILSAFNKGISGGGFGPVVTAGQILAGQGPKGAIGATTLAEAPICIASFITYVIGKTFKEAGGSFFNMPVNYFFDKLFSNNIINWQLILALFLGSVLVAPFGAFTTKKLNDKYIHIILGTLIIILGILTLLKVASC